MKTTSNTTTSRRRFLATSAALALSSPLVVPPSVLGKDGKMAPSNRIGIAVFGVGNRGSDSIRAMAPLPDHQIVAIADCRRDRAERARDVVDNMYANRAGFADYKGCDVTWDFEEVLDRPDVDAIWGTVPDHWHGPIYSRMIRSGKDIYGEKPLTRYVKQGVKVVQMARQYGTIFQVGTQQRSSPHFRHACELARNGYLGQISRIEVAAPRGAAYPTAEPCDVPEGFNYDRWSGPAPFFPFDSRRCEWLAMYMISHYCAGFITNWGVHHLDIAGWGVPEIQQKPFTLDPKWGEMPNGGMTDTWVGWRVEMKWESGLILDFCSTGDPHPQGCRFVGDEGWVHVNRAGIEASSPSLLDVKMKPEERLRVSPGSDASRAPEYAYTPHTADFFRSIRTRQDPIAPVEQGHFASTFGNVSDIALRVGRKLTWDWDKSEFIGDDEANQMLSRAERAPWTM